MNTLNRAITALLLTLIISATASAEESLWDRAKSGTEEGVEWSGEKIEQGADWTTGRAQKGWSATKKGAKSFWQELTADDEPDEKKKEKPEEEPPRR